MKLNIAAICIAFISHGIGILCWITVLDHKDSLILPVFLISTLFSAFGFKATKTLFSIENVYRFHFVVATFGIFLWLAGPFLAIQMRLMLYSEKHTETIIASSCFGSFHIKKPSDIMVSTHVNQYLAISVPEHHNLMCFSSLNKKGCPPYFIKKQFPTNTIIEFTGHIARPIDSNKTHKKTASDNVIYLKVIVNSDTLWTTLSSILTHLVPSQQNTIEFIANDSLLNAISIAKRWAQNEVNCENSATIVR